MSKELKMNNKKLSLKVSVEKYAGGITLISLVITIIILIILAGVAVNLSIGKNGIFTRAKQAKEAYAQSIAKEKVEVVLLDALIEKNENSEYNSKDFLDDMLEESGIEVNGDEVTVDNYIFTIDREELKIIEENGESNIKLTKEVKSYKGKNANGKYEAEILVIIESDKELQSIEIINPDGTILTIETNKTKIAKDMVVEFEEEYKVIITTKEGKTSTRNIIEKSEETIRTAQELAEFRDKVNSGLTYEGKTIKQLKNINLAEVCSSEIGTWIPIGESKQNYFGGTYDGNNNELQNLYIKIALESPISLFGVLGYTGKVENFTVTGSVERTNNMDAATSAIVGRNEGIVENITNKAVVSSKGISTVGGIVGNNLNLVKRCTNSGSITSTSSAGGICGASAGTITTANITEDIQPKIQECQNTTEAIITGKNSVGGILGEGNSKINITVCYNAGTINGEDCVGGIAGAIWNADGKYGYLGNNYNIGNINATIRSAGGLFGTVSINKEVDNSYSIGKVTCPQYAGGVIGENNGVNLNNLYYLNKGGVENGCGINNTSSVLEEPKGSTEETLKSLAKKFNDDLISRGYNTAWRNDETNINNGYPILKWQVENI